MKRLMLITVVCAFVSAPVWADPFPNNTANDVWNGNTPNGIPTAQFGSDGIPDIFDAVNRLLGTGHTRNEHVDPLFVQPDEIWQELNGEIALIGLTAGNTNTVGTYTDLGVGLVRNALMTATGFGWTGDGTMATPYPAALTSLGHGSLYGWYLQSNGALYYSQAGLNPSGWDHTMTYDLAAMAGTTIYINTGSGAQAWTLTSPYLICWEDLNMGDEDYDDMIYLVDRVAPIPLPGAVLLGLLGLGVAGLKLRKYT